MKRFRALLLLTPFLFSLLSGVSLFVQPEPVSADALDNLGVICEKGSTGESDIRKDGSRYTLPANCLKIEILSRTKLRVTFPSDASKRLNPTGNNQTKIGIFEGTYSSPEFGSLAYKDPDTLSGIVPNTRNLGQNIQANNLHERWDVLSDDEIKRIFREGIIVIAADNQGDEFGEADFCKDNDPTDQNFGLQKEKAYWDCYDNISSVYQLNISESNLTGSLSNFNVTHTASEDGRTLNSVYDGNDVTRDSFVFCDSGSYEGSYVLGGNCNAPRDGYTISANPETFLNSSTHLVTVSGQGKPSFRIRIGGSNSAAAIANNAALEEENAGGAEPTCENEGGDFAWILCPALRYMDNIMTTLDNQIASLLRVPDPYLEDGGIKNAWRRMRALAYIVLIPMMLVMVISTALGFEFVSAYTVKKSMPRLIAAVLFIALSYEICAFLIRLTNDVGSGIFSLITHSVSGAGDITITSIFNPSLVNAGTGALAGTAALVTIAAVGSIGILFSYMLVALIGIFVGFILLSFRQFLLIGLVLFSPIAILAWIFPGNDKLWKLWWQTFSKLLLLFPLIMVLIASGRAFAFVVQEVNPQPGDGAFTGTMATMIKIIAYVGPYFFIPAAFKFAGGIFANVAGIANDREKGLFDRQRKYRGRKASENWRDTKAGDKAWRPRAFNDFGERLGVGVGGRFGVGSRGRSAIRTQRRNNAAERMSKDEELKQLALASDDGNAVMALAGSPGGARAAADDLRDSWLQDDEEYQRAEAAFNASGGTDMAAQATMQARRDHFQDRANVAYDEAMAVGVTRSRSQAAMSTMMQNKARAIVGGEAGRQVLERGLNRIHGQSAADGGAREETRQAMAFFARESGRSDLGGGSVMDGFERTGAYKTVRGHVNNVRAVSDELTTEFQQAVSAGDEVRAIEAASKITAMRQSMGPDVAEENKTILTDMFQQVGIDVSSAQSVDEQLGGIIAQRVQPVAGGPISPRARQDRATQHIRTRAGLYDQGDPALRGGPPGGGLGPIASDIRLKTDVKKLTEVNGIPIYKFRYFWKNQIYVGVMAQDIITTHPYALSRDEFGYYYVNYDALGLRMITFEEWEATSDLSALPQDRN